VKEPVLVVSVGPFGGAVARHLRALRPDTAQMAVEGDPGSDLAWPPARLIVLAAWRPVPDLCERLDGFSHERRRPFVPAIADGATLSLGPVVVPGAAGCWRCWIQRTCQHAAGQNRRPALWQHYAQHAGDGPEGYLEPFALMAAARLSATVEALDAGEALPGQVWQIDMINRKITTSTVVGVHDCPRCGLHRPGPTRSHAEMQQALAYLWNHGRNEVR